MSSFRLCSLEHAEAEGAGKIAEWAVRRGHPLQVVRLDRGEPLPGLADFDMLVIMGGAMNVYQDRDYPWLPSERALVAAAIEAGKVVLGVCLGAQLIADALGGRVVQNPVKEIGWFPVRQCAAHELFAGFPEECTAFHWHGDTFQLPAEAARIAESAACRNQAFVFGERTVGLQFHVEVSPVAVQSFLVGADDYLQPEQWVQTAAEIRGTTPDLAATDRGLEVLLDGLAKRRA
ncbi:MAG TPA: type 1 glutamine amidotransferase [Chthoniobacteraceae bacterium]|jgi:GMP synthase-like glutamine amidotransferase|nr:type 1 glutamine amidotransferase [Chthoniobacteraceae bacterium]